MQHEVTSQHLRGATELTVLMPIKQSFVPIRDTLSYASRLRILLNTLHRIRKTGLEALQEPGFVGPIERLRTINFVRWSILNNDRDLLLAVSFDQPWEPYIRTIYRDAGPVLDSILCHCAGYEDQWHTSAGDYAGFEKWVREYQVRSEFFYAGASHLTTDDLRYLTELEQKQRETKSPLAFDRDAAGFAVGAPSAAIEDAKKDVVESQGFAPNRDPTRSRGNRVADLIEQGIRGINTMYRLSKYFPAKDGKSHAHEYLRRTAQIVLSDFDSKKWIAKDHDARLGINYKAALEWFEAKPAVKHPAHSRRKPEAGEKAAIQGNILTGYDGMTHGCLLFMSIVDSEKARNSLAAISRRITTDSDVHHVNSGEQPGVNIGFTRQGLENIGLSPGELRTLPKAFREGMEARAGLLGDVRTNHPNNWNLPERNWPLKVSHHTDKVMLSTIDIVIQLQSIIPAENQTDDDYDWTDEHPLYEDVTEWSGYEGLRLLSVQPQRRYPAESGNQAPEVTKHPREHFGFADGISQPAPSDTKEVDAVRFGEVLLGYDNDRGDRANDKLGPLLDNGTFLVIRKLRQYVGRFNKFLDENTSVIGRDELGAKLMGRTFAGETSIKPGAGPTNEFDYAGDEEGKRCPLQSHVRRANPRTPQGPNEAPVPRIMRRGFSYGPRYREQTKEIERGLFFMAYNASIAEQFEVIQRWLTGGNSTGVASAQADPFLAVPWPRDKRTIRFFEGGDVHRYDLGEEPFVTLEWGMYLFVPSRDGLAYLAAPARQKNEELVKQGEEIIAGLDILAKVTPVDERDEALLHQWKKILEDPIVRAGGYPEALWAAIRENYQGVLRTPYGVLVADEEKIRDILRNDNDYSVREYWRRMQDSLGQGFLGMDPEPQEIGTGASADQRELDSRYRNTVEPGQYQAESALANSAIADVSIQQAFTLARDAALKVLAQLAPLNNGDKAAIDLKAFAAVCLSKLAQGLFGLPDEKHIFSPINAQRSPNCPGDFVSAGRYVFSPRPTDTVTKAGEERGKDLKKAALAYVQAVRENGISKAQGKIGQLLFENIEDDDTLARTLVGLVNGLVLPTLGSFVLSTKSLIETEQLWRLQQALPRKEEGDNTDDSKTAIQILMPGVVRAMQVQPAPSLLHRTAINQVELGNEKIHPGDRIVLALESGTRQQAGKTEMLFGGSYENGSRQQNTPLHACPGQDMALGIITGMLAALLQYGTLHPEPIPTVLQVTRS